jgi:hypothetical protein
MNNETQNAVQLLPVPQPGGLITRDSETAAASSAAIAEIQAQYAVAFRNPRHYDTVRRRILDACARPGFQAAARYAKPVGTGKVEGWSVRAAEEFLRDMGNVRINTVTTFESESERKIRITATDMESNATFGRELTLQKTVERKGEKVVAERPQDIISSRVNSYGDKVYIVRATEDELLQKESAAVSKVVRNEGLRLIPGDLLEEALACIKGGKDAGRAVLAATEEAHKVIDAFALRGIAVREIESYIGVPVKQFTVADLIDLREIFAAMRDEGARWSEYMEAKRLERETPAASTDGTGKAAKLPDTPGHANTAAPGATGRTRRTTRQILAEKAAALGLKVKPTATVLELDAQIKAAEANAAANPNTPPMPPADAGHAAEPAPEPAQAPAPEAPADPVKAFSGSPAKPPAMNPDPIRNPNGNGTGKPSKDMFL